MAERQTEATTIDAANPDQHLSTPALTPELARAVTDRVFALFLHDLKLERERRRRPVLPVPSRQGGWS